SGEKRVFLVILFTSFSGSLVSRISGAVQPLYRQSEIYRRQGVELSRATLGRWTGAVAELLEPLYDVLRQY
ncbi:IS66 family transposase, partial [Escherichia coli]|nr:IS66 family transposase [Escherichia coli]